jgi:uncharacterized protein YndB with AHSA1/START domain
MKNQTTITAEPGKQDTMITREFDAPRVLVFKAFTEPGLFKQWMGPRKLRTEMVHFSAKSNGSCRYISREDNGKEHGFHGVFHEVLVPERVIQTFEYEGLPEKGHVALDKATFESLPGDRTKVTVHTVFLTLADRDGMLQSGMESGVRESHERLDELLEKLNARA